MTRRPPGLTDTEWADYLDCENDHQADLDDVAAREAAIENGQEPTT
ncbi:hypothetical protein [Bacillus cereus]